MDIMIKGAFNYIIFPILSSLTATYVYSDINTPKKIEEEFDKREQGWTDTQRWVRDEVKKLEGMFLYDKQNGIDCWVGVSKALEENESSVFYVNQFKLKDNDTFFLTNEKNSKYCPTFKFRVDKIDGADPSNSKADLFISFEAAHALGIPEDRIKDGLFPMKIHLHKLPIHESTEEDYSRLTSNVMRLEIFGRGEQDPMTCMLNHESIVQLFERNPGLIRKRSII